MSVILATPAGCVFEGVVQSLRLPGDGGSFGVRPGHAPLLAALTAGHLQMRTADGVKTFLCGSGLAEVQPQRTVILVERAEPVDTEKSMPPAAGQWPPGSTS